MPEGGYRGYFTAVRLTWNNAGTSARVQISTNGTNGWTEIDDWGYPVKVRRRTASLIEVFGLSGTKFFRVAALNADGASAWTTALQVTCGTGKPAVGNLAAPVATLATNSATQLRITFTDAQTYDSNFEVELINSINGTRRIYSLPTFAREFVRGNGEDGVTPQTTYVARVRAVSVQQTSLVSQDKINGPWSNELVFTTPAPQIAILRGSYWETVFWRNAPAQSFAVPTNLPPTTVSTTTLPTGLTLSGAVISGTPSVAVGSYGVDVTVENATSDDEQALTILVDEPRLLLLFSGRETGPFFSAGLQPADVTQFTLGVAKTIYLRGEVAGPISPELVTVSLTGAPDWLNVDGTTITGTPAGAGVWNVTVTASNGTQSVAARLTITVAALAFTSAATLSVREDAAISFTATAVPANAILTSSGLPAWLTFEGGRITGTAPVEGAGDYLFDLAAEVAGSVIVQPFTLTILPIISGPLEVTGWQGDQLLEGLFFHGAALPEQWHLSNAPGGITIAVHAATSISTAGNFRRAELTGAPAVFGIFESVVTVQSIVEGAPRLYRQPVNFKISGGTFLHWFHAEPFRRELQVLLRNNTVRSFYETGNEVLTLKRGDDVRLHVIFRDGPFSDSRLGREIIADGFAELRLVIRPLGQYDAEPYLELGGAITIETIGEDQVFYLDFKVTSAAIEAAFDSANLPQAATAAAASLAATGEVQWKRNDRLQSSLPFTVKINQDIER